MQRASSRHHAPQPRARRRRPRRGPFSGPVRGVALGRRGLLERAAAIGAGEHTPDAANKDYRAPDVEQMAMPENTYVPDGNTAQGQETPPPAETQPTADPPEPDRLSDDDGDCERSPEDLLDMHMEAIAVRGAQSDLTVAQASAALYTLKRQRGDGQDLALAL